MKGTAVGGLLLLAFSVSACGIADHYQAQSRMEKSEDAYRKCLLEHTADPASCDALKKFYEQDKAAYEKT
jgi:hypothetical protein